MKQNIWVYIWIENSPGANTYVLTKRKQPDLKLRKLYWVVGRQSQLSLGNILLVYKAVLKRIWTYGVQLWGSASTSNIDILESFQSKVLRMVVGAAWCVPNAVIKRDKPVLSVRREIPNYSVTYRQIIDDHPNRLVQSLFQRPNYNRKLNPLNTKRRLLYLKTQFVPRSKHFSSRLQKPISLCCKWHKSLFVLR